MILSDGIFRQCWDLEWGGKKQASGWSPREDVESTGLPPHLHKQGLLPSKAFCGMEPESFILFSFSVRFTFPMLNPVNFIAQKPFFGMGLSALKTPFKKCQGAVNIK